MSKKKSISTGKHYTDGKGGVRLVTAEGDFAYSDSIKDRDWVKFRIVAKKRGPHLVGSEHQCTRTAFASWMKSECLKP